MSAASQPASREDHQPILFDRRPDSYVHWHLSFDGPVATLGIAYFFTDNIAAGDVVRICDLDGTEFARGIAKFGGEEVRARKLARVEIVHRDDLVIL